LKIFGEIMPFYEIDSKRPVIGSGTWVAPSAEIIGDVEIGENCYIGFGAIIRGDFGKIKIGSESLIEECVNIHTAEMTDIGNNVIVGHMVMLHDAFIHDEALIGMKSMICEYATIGKGAIVAEQSLVRKKSKVPPDKIVAGSPAAIVGNVDRRHRDRLALGRRAYQDLIQSYHSSFRLVQP
jgi:carbonic anhydrase/acetyltransferase-like protein (isoleucine patch superfamily)